jgi:hypothetical protein
MLLPGSKMRENPGSNTMGAADMLHQLSSQVGRLMLLLLLWRPHGAR